MWGARREDEQQEGNAPPPPLYNQAGYQQQPPAPPQQQHYPPPPQQQQYSNEHHGQHEYPDDDDDTGALSMGINLVTSGVSALFRSGGAAQVEESAPPPPPPVNNMPPPLQPESSMLSASHSHTAVNRPIITAAPPVMHPQQQQSYVPPPTNTTAAPPVATDNLRMYGAPPAATAAPPIGFSAGPPVNAALSNAFASGPPTVPQQQPPAASGPPPTNVQQENASGPPQAPGGMNRAPNAAASNNAFAPPTNIMMHQPPVVASNDAPNAFAGVPQVASNNAFTGGPPIMNAAQQPPAFAGGPPTNAQQQPNAPPVAANAYASGPPTTTAFAGGPPTNVQQPADEANMMPPPVAPNAFAPPTTMEPPTNNATPATPAPPPVNVPVNTIASSPMPSPVITSLPSPSASSHGSSHRSAHHHLLPPRSTTPVSASSPRPRYKLPPLSLPRPHASPKMSASPKSRKWGGFKCPPPITTTSSAKKKTAVPGGITLKTAAAPSPMPSPRLDTTPRDDDVAPAPSPFVPPPPAHVTPTVGHENDGFGGVEQQTPGSLDMPQLMDTPSAPAIVQATPAPPPVVAVEESPMPKAPPPVTEQVSAPTPPMFVAAPPQDNAAPPMFVPAPPNETPVESAPPIFAAAPQETTTAPPPAPPVFVAAPPAAPIEETAPPPLFVAAPPAAVPIEETAPPPVFVAAPPAAPIEETAPPPVFVAAPPAAPVEETAPPPAFAAAGAPPLVNQGPPMAGAAPPVNQGAPPMVGAVAPPPPPNDFAAVSPEDERPRSDQQSERSSSMEYPEETVAQEDLVAPPPEEEQHSQPALPEPWTEEVDEASQQLYYYNSVTGETRWDRPTEEEAPVPVLEEETQVQEPPPEQTYSHEEQVVDDDDAGTPHSEESSVSQPPLPPGWTEEVDPSTGASYYYSSATGETTWDRPSEEDGDMQEAPAPALEEETQSQELPPEHTYSQEEQVVGDDDTGASHEEESSVSQPALPPGWTEEVDPSTGASYYYSSVTGETSWERPVAEENNREQETALVEDNALVAVALPDGWVEEIDEATGQPYYYHAASEVTTWERPSDEAASTTEAADADEYVSEPVATDTDGTEEEARDDGVQEELEETGPESAVRKASVDGSETTLPEGWTEHFDPSSGKPYYVNSAENVTSWERPCVPQAAGVGADDSQPTDDAIAEPPSITRATDRQETDSLPESTAFATEEQAIALEAREPAQVDDSAAVATEAAALDGNLDEGPLESELEGTEAPAGDLPEEWEEVVDQDSGRIYYYNTVDGTTSWDRPETSAPAQGQRSPDSEPERTSETELSTNAPPISADSWNLVSSQGSFDVIGDQGRATSNPEEQVESTTSAAAESEEQEETETAAPVDAPGLPPDWIELIDPSSGNAYYLNEVTNETTWERPVIRAVEAEETAADEAVIPPTEPEQPASEAAMPAESTDITESAVNDGIESEGFALGAVSMEVNFNESRDEAEIDAIDRMQPTIDEHAALPPGWTELVHEESGKTYYLNEADGTTTWDRPVGTTEEEPKVDEPATKEENTLETKSVDKDEHVATQDDVPAEAIEKETEQYVTAVASETEPIEALPPGWTEMTDPSSGRPYYVNEADNTTTWDKPVASTSAPDDAKAVPEEPEDATESIPIATEKETPVAEEQDAAPNDAKGHAADSEAKSESTLPAGWVEMKDPSSGKSYYFNETENVTTWDRPEPVVVEPTPTVEDSSSALPENAPEDIGDGYTMVEHSETASKEEPNNDGAIKDAPSSDEQAGLPPGWVELVDDSSGASYYLNEAENITTWDRPTAVPGTTKAATTESSVTSPQEAKDAPVEELAILEGWSEVVDPGSKQTYYFNEETGETTWDRPSVPAASAIPSGASKVATKSDRSPGPHAFATFGFGGKLCVWKAKAPSTVAVYRTGYLLKNDPVVLAEQKKKESKVVGPLNSCDDGDVLRHLDSKTHLEPSNETARSDLLWSLALVAAKSNGRLRSDGGVRNPDSPEAGIISLLLDESSELKDSASLSTDEVDSQHDDGMKGEVASLSSLKKVEKLLLWGKREEAVQEAISSNNFAMALLVASMCDRSTFQDATKQFADEILSSGSPLHTLAMLFSGQLQPPASSALDRTGSKPSIWDDGSQNLASTWRQHLAATISNRTLGWDRIVLALGDNLLDSGHVHAAHFCYMVCGCPVSSLLHPSSRMCLVGCDHVVKMDAALMTPEGVAGYERTEAYEWAKRRGNPTAAIPSLQPFKLMYAMLLADMGLEGDALLYVESVRQCCGLEGLTEGYAAARIPSTVWALSVKGSLKDTLNEFEDRLCQGKFLSHVKLASEAGDSGKTASVSDTGPFASQNAPPFQPAATTKRKKKVVKPMRPKKSPLRSSVGSMDTVSEDEMYTEPDGHNKDEDMNATFLSAQSNLLDVTATSTGDATLQAGAPPTMQAVPAPSGDRHQAFLGAASREQKLDPRAAATAKPSATGAPPMMQTQGKAPPVMTPAPSKQEDAAAKKEQAKKKIQQPPNSAPAMLSTTKKDKSISGTPKKQGAPSSDKSPSRSLFGFKEKISKYLNPDATVADPGESMQAYYDDDRKVWVFPGDDPDEVAKPIGPPPTIPAATEEKDDGPASAPPAAAAAPVDPLAAMMAPPSRASLIRRSSSTMSTMEKAAPRYPSMMGGPPGSANRGMPSPGGVGPPSLGGGPPPQFTVFKPAPAPAPAPAKEGEEEKE